MLPKELVEHGEVVPGLFEAGHSFLLVGAAGIGKTAILHEVVRRSIVNGSTKRFVQISLRHRASSLTNPGSQMGPAMQQLSQALVELGPSVVPVIRDFDHVYVYGRDGAGARDPRTGRQHPRLKDVLKGDLAPFLDAWRQLP
ncbi:MAG: hypothetical protein E2P02_15045 [Acidobacteria bacterium]|nr:MAG: hypothetical protein E2P02_15045 [Acidobacteriota bacterium]